MSKKIVFLCGARDFHAMDWYKSAKESINDREVLILTDLIEGEGFRKIITDNDHVIKLFILDKYLFKKQSGLGNIWRNVLKLLILPIQVFLLKQFAKNNPDSVYHAHSMYYLWLAWLANVDFVGTPQGSDILIKPFRSKIFRFLSVNAMRAAKAVTVDSENMKIKIEELSGVNAHIIQNGIDLQALSKETANMNIKERKIYLLSIRGMTSLYRINEAIDARNQSNILNKTGITFIYPFYEDQYTNDVKMKMIESDKDLGRVDRARMYEILHDTKLIISIPISDSSPRSVYEAIFCGCAVAITSNSYYNIMPECMKSRVIIVNLENNYWLEEALEKANLILRESYKASDEALEMFDQRLSFKKVEKLLLNK